MKQKNNDISLFKFLYAGIIVLYHLKNYTTGVDCPGGSFGVEFFLLSSGVFLFAAYERQSAAGSLLTPGQYLWKRFSRFFPWSLTAFIFTAVVHYGILEPVGSKWEILDNFSSDIWEILMIKWNGMNEGQQLLNGPAWTLSAMCIVGFLIWGCLYYFGEKFLNLFMPLSIIVGYGVWRHLDYAGTEVWIGFSTFGTFRTWLVMCLSYYCFRLSKRIAQVRWKKLGISLLTLTEIGLHALSLIIIFNRATRYYQWFVTLMMLIALAIALSGNSWIVRILNNSKIADFLGELSMSVFLMHMPVIQLYRYKIDIADATVIELLPLFGIIVVAAVIHLYLTKLLIRAASFCWKKGRAMLID